MAMKQASIALSALATLSAAIAVPALAQKQYPERAIRVVIPYPPGGASDILGRIIGRRLGEKFGKQIVIDNRPGGGAIIGTHIVAQATPDGHTLALVSTPMGINPALYAKLPYDTLRDFAPIAFAAYAGIVMIAHPSVAVRTPAELIAAAKAKPDTFTVATPGPGSMGHLTLELLNRQAGMQLRHIPYKGAAPGLADLIGGQVNFMFDNISPAKPNILSGRTRAIAVASIKRTPALPDVTTFHESGLNNFEAASWFGYYAPAGTPRAIIDKLNTEINAIVASGELKDLYARDAYDASPMTPAEFDRFLRVQIDKWVRVVREAGIKPQ
jgi:tripartite-type tricarboxylate transporter receptor subunit TctC